MTNIGTLTSPQASELSLGQSDPSFLAIDLPDYLLAPRICVACTSRPPPFEPDTYLKPQRCAASPIAPADRRLN